MNRSNAEILNLFELEKALKKKSMKREEKLSLLLAEKYSVSPQYSRTLSICTFKS